MKICPRCEAIFDEGKWQYGEQIHAEVGRNEEVERVICPGCAKIERREIGGIIHLRGSFINQHAQEILNLVENEAEKKRRKNIAARIAKITTLEDGMDVELTDHTLAERIGKGLEKAFSGKLEIQWLKKEHFARLKWEREQ